jgi:mannose-6-phosphate isomerase
VTLRPTRLQPIFSPRPWGVRSLAPFFPEKGNLAEPMGEAWMTGNECVFADGPFAGQRLGDAWPKMEAAWRGAALSGEGIFPLLTKFIFTAEKLSVQVHPDDEYARAHEAAAGGRGKTEMWYALRAAPGAEVLAGLKPTVTPAAFSQAIFDATAEDCLAHAPVAAGDAIFVPAQTAHTIGAGLILCEIQQHSDLTYRVYDYDRRDAQGRARELHVEKALAVIRFGEQISAKLEPLVMERQGVRETYFVACRYFATEKWEFGAPVARRTAPEHFDLLLTLEGRGEILWGDGGDRDTRAAYAPAQAWLLPATLGEFRLQPANATSLLRTYVPASAAEFGKQMEARGASGQEWKRLVRW